MPDLVTHLAAGHWVSRIDPAARPGRLSPGWTCFLVGCALPDLATRAIYHLFPLGPLAAGLAPLHAPAPLAVLCYLISLGFIEELRPRAFAGLFAGSCLHVALDLFQRNIKSSYLLLYPFSFEGYQFGLWEPGATIPWIPVILLVSIVVEVLCAWRCRGRRRDSQASTG